MPDPTKKKSKYQLALEKIAKEKGFKPEDFVEYQKQVRYLESKNDYSAIQKPKKGYTKAPGRGAYQYELSVDGGSGSSVTAINRAKQWAKDNDFELPEDLNEDFSKMSPETQDLVDLLNYRKAPSGNFDYIKNKDYKTAYLSHHWAGNESEYENKAKYYDNNMKQYKKQKSKLFLGGLLQAIQLGSAAAQGVQSAKNQLEARDTNLKKQTNPYGIMEKGGELEGKNSKNYKGPSHDGGGININPNGQVGPNGPEVEGEEVKYKFTKINKGVNYVFPAKLKKAIQKIEKKYKKGSDIDISSKEVELDKLMKQNEIEKSKLGIMEDQPKLSFGADLTELSKKILKPQAIKSIVPQVKLNPRQLKAPELTGTPATPKPVFTEDESGDITGAAKVKMGFDAISAASGVSPTKRRYNPNEAETERLAKSSLQFDNTALKNMILGKANAAKSQIRNSNRGQEVVNANIANINNNEINQLANAEISKNQLLGNRKMNVAQVVNNLGQQRAAVDERADITDSQNAAGAANTISNSLNDNVTVQKYLNNLDVNDKNFRTNLKVIQDKYPNFKMSEYISEMKNAKSQAEKDYINKKYISSLEFRTSD